MHFDAILPVKEVNCELKQGEKGKSGMFVIESHTPYENITMTCTRSWQNSLH